MHDIVYTFQSQAHLELSVADLNVGSPGIGAPSLLDWFTANGGSSSHRFHITFFPDRFAKNLDAEDKTLSELRTTILSTTAPTKEQLPWLKLAAFGPDRTEAGCLRHDDNVWTISGIELDYDGGEMPFYEAIRIAEDARLYALIYATANHKIDHPKWRLLLPLSCERDPKQRAGLVARVNGVYGGIFAPESFALSAAYYYGHLEGRRFEYCEVTEGDFIDLRDDLDAGAIGKHGQTFEEHEPAQTNYEPEDCDPEKIGWAFVAIPNDDEPCIEWERKGLALAKATGGSPEGKEIFDFWSRKSGKYERRETDRRWRGFCRKPADHLNVGSIFYWANQADPNWEAPYYAAKGINPERLAKELLDNVLAKREPAQEEAAQGQANQAPNTQSPSASTKPKTSIISIGEWVRSFGKATDPLIEDADEGEIIGRGQQGVLFGPKGTGKTSVAIEMACSVATGLGMGIIPITNQIICRSQKGRVLFAVYEDPFDYRRRILALSKRRGVNLDTLDWSIVGTEQNVTKEKDRAELLRQIRSDAAASGPPALLVIDTVAAALGTESTNDDDVVGKLFVISQTLVREFQCTVVFVAHPGKDESKGIAGSYRFQGNSDFILRTVEMTNGWFRLMKDKDRGGPVRALFDYTLEYVEVERTASGKPRTGAILGMMTPCLQASLPHHIGKGQMTLDQIAAIVSAVGQGGWRKDPRAEEWVGKAIAPALGLDADRDAENIKKVLAKLIKDGVLKEVLRRGDDRKEHPCIVAVTPAPESTRASVPFMITLSMKAQLRALGFTAEQIAEMTPAQAHEILSNSGT